MTKPITHELREAAEMRYLRELLHRAANVLDALKAENNALQKQIEELRK